MDIFSLTFLESFCLTTNHYGYLSENSNFIQYLVCTEREIMLELSSLVLWTSSKQARDCFNILVLFKLTTYWHFLIYWENGRITNF